MPSTLSRLADRNSSSVDAAVAVASSSPARVRPLPKVRKNTDPAAADSTRALPGEADRRRRGKGRSGVWGWPGRGQGRRPCRPRTSYIVKRREYMSCMSCILNGAGSASKGRNNSLTFWCEGWELTCTKKEKLFS
jgi:hypothetical protein